MERFAFVLHPLRHKDFTRKYGILRLFPPRLVENAFGRLQPWAVSHITGVKSATGAEAEGWFIVVPMTPRVLMESQWETVLPRITRAGQIAEQLGAGIVGLGAFLKIVGDRGVSVSKNLNIPVTTGNSYTAASAVEGSLAGAERLGIELKNAQATVIGATGAIGAACARILARSVPKVTLVARNVDRLDRLADDMRPIGAEVEISTEPRRSVKEADIVLTVSSATDVLIEPEDLKPGAVVCDVARPRNISTQIYERRNDVLVMDGGVISVPGENLNFRMKFGFPPGMAEACMAETIILALEKRYESFTLGADISVEKVEEINRLAKKHGFKIAGFRRFEQAISEEEIELIRERTRPRASRAASRPNTQSLAHRP